MKKSVFIAAFIFVGCVTTKAVVTPNPSQGDVDRVQSKFPGYTLAELNEGKTLFEKHCDICHALQPPASQTEEKWRKIVPDMSDKVNRKEGNVLDEKAEDLILKYLITMSDAPRN